MRKFLSRKSPKEESEKADDDQYHPAADGNPKPASAKQGCRPRIDYLALPNRRLILALYKDHAHHLPREKLENVEQLLQELYAMTPEETERYFAHLRRQSEENAKRKNLKAMLKKVVRKRKTERQRHQAYELLRELLVKGMEHALRHPVPPLVSVRLRHLSDMILEQLSDLRNVEVPSRHNPDNVGAFLIAVSDWMAVAIERIYYGVQLKKNQELEQIEDEFRARQAHVKDVNRKDVSEADGQERLEVEIDIVETDAGDETE
ncbi:uncharacterized protein LOC132706294 [Cylas formicarius]|uniref:uncharacterized protein LOC132706294 n=1 Tax=Cylas formicarius TaxID=197179 RepID=UPI002958A544|nr:uncharacterized protein LOC132706294 [Cylas formicarius]